METKTHWKAASDPNFFGSYAFNAERQDIIDMVISVEKKTVINPTGNEEEKLVMNLRYGLPFVLNVTNSKTMERLCSSPYIEEWANCWVQFYITKVKAFGGGEKVDGVRLRGTIPMLTDKHPAWDQVCKSITEGTRTIEQIKKSFKTNETAVKMLSALVKK